jgi:WD40 repeat protein
VSSGLGGVREWDLKSGASTVLMEGVVAMKPSADGRHLAGIRAPMRPGGIAGTAVLRETNTGRTWDLSAHGREVTSIVWLPSGRQVVTGSRDGIVRIGGIQGEEPHLLMGHEGAVWSVTVDPHGRRIASAGEDGSVRLWHVPDGPPLHTLPLSELLERLGSLTNYRIVEEPAASTGYRLDFEPFTGWNRQPPRW